MNLSTSDKVELRWMLDSYVPQNVSHLVRSPLNVLGVSLGSFILLSLSVLLGGMLSDGGGSVGATGILLLLSDGGGCGLL